MNTAWGAGRTGPSAWVISASSIVAASAISWRSIHPDVKRLQTDATATGVRMAFPCTTDPFVILVAIRGIHGPRLRISLCPPRCCPPGIVAHGDTLFSVRITLNPNSGPALVGALLYRALLPQR